MKCFTLTQNKEGRDIVLPFLPLREEPFVRVGAPGSCTKVPLDTFNTAIAEAAFKKGKPLVELYKADLAKERKACLISEHDPINDACLVLVEYEHPGQFWYEANTYDEIIYQERRREKVRRSYRPFTDARGIGIVGHGCGPHGEPHALLHMLPGASFRICRDVVDRSPVLVIAWPGTKLKVITPYKYKKMLEEPAA